MKEKLYFIFFKCLFQTLAIKFGNEENAKKFHEAFEEMRKYVLKMEAKKIKEEEEKNLCPAAAEGSAQENGINSKLSEMTVNNS